MPRFDESDPKIIKILPPRGEHDHVEEFGEMFQKWIDRMEAGGDRFGIMLINEPHDHDHDGEEGHEHQRNEEEENAITALVTKFRRENRERTNQSTIGYASVYTGEMTDEQFEKANERTAQFAAYMFGVRGQMFKQPEQAAAWLHEVAELEPLPLEGKGDAADGATSAAIFYGSTTGATELIAEKVQAAWASANGETLPIVNVGDQSQLMNLLQYNKLLLGIPTWNIGKLQDDWEIVYPYLERIDLSDKTIAIFGVGDQYGYPENFQDAMGILGFKLIERGATLVGYTSVTGYEHEYSKAIDGDQFIGLAIDDVNQPELTDGRVKAWVSQVTTEFNQ
ncbi:MAG: flavodoxin [Chloroflexota bacterium]